jgi:hypothetical protein
MKSFSVFLIAAMIGSQAIAQTNPVIGVADKSIASGTYIFSKDLDFSLLQEEHRPIIRTQLEVIQAECEKDLKAEMKMMVEVGYEILFVNACGTSFHSTSTNLPYKSQTKGSFGFIKK